MCYKLHFLYILWYNKGLVANRRLHQMIICGRMYTAAGNEVTMAEYTGKDIVILEGLEAVRKRPGMYIGSTGSRGLHHLIWEILDNAIDEHLAGYCSEIHITLQKEVASAFRIMVAVFRSICIPPKKSLQSVSSIRFCMPAVNLAILPIRYPVVCTASVLPL